MQADLYVVQYGINMVSPDVAQLVKQGSHRLEKNLKIEGFLEKSLKIKYALKSSWNHL